MTNESLSRCRAAATLLAALLTLGAQAPPAGTFAGHVASLSEPGGYFDTDNLISNERSYLHVAGVLDTVRPGGAYLGVGPDQNFSYIARVRPAIALIVDIRRDNLLLHLLFKALFAESANRAAFVAHLTGRAPPAGAEWARAPVEQLVAYIDRTPPLDRMAQARLSSRLTAAIERTGIPLTPADDATIGRFHSRFIDEGLSLQFNSTGRPPQWGYPTYRDLLLEVDRRGVKRNYLASEVDFQFLKTMQADDRLIPVVGDLAGSHALPALARFLRARGTSLSAVYTSNVEFYLFRQGTFGRFADNLARIPTAADAVIIRSAFGGGAYAEPGYNSASLTQTVRAFTDDVAAGRVRRYGDVIAGSR